MRSSSRASSIRLGSYQLFERIGEGATSHVYRGEAEDGRSVAVKLLAPQAELDDPAARARLEREIRILAGVRHPNLVELLDHGVDDELGPYLVMQHLEGDTLRDVLAGTRACPEAVLLVLAPILAALEALHANGLVHRDVKPENLMVTRDGRVMLVDLGLAYAQGYTRYTDEGAVVGSVPYMSPEQVEGGAVDTSADVWAVGVITYEWVTGTRPFQRERPAEEAAALLVGAYTPLAEADRRCPPELSRLVASCLAARPDARPTSRALAESLAGLVDWIEADAAPRELAAVISDPSGYQARIAGARVALLKRQAEEHILRGDGFGALRFIDRALAYAPDDPSLLGLCERAEAAAARPAHDSPAVVAPPEALALPRSRKRLVVGSAVAVLLLAALAAVAILQPGREETREEREQRQTEAALRMFGGMMRTVEHSIERDGVRPTVSGDPQEAAAALQFFNGVLDLYERGLELQQKIEARDAGPDAGSDAGPDARTE